MSYPALVCRAGMLIAHMCLVLAFRENATSLADRNIGHRKQLTFQQTPKCAQSQERCNVVVVVDMQNDYCSACDESDSATASPWAASTIKEISPNVANVLKERKWDMVVVTKDIMSSWREGQPHFLEAGTAGINLVKELRDVITQLNLSHKQITFTKDTDDWMNELWGDKSFDHNRHFSLDDELKYLPPSYSLPRGQKAPTFAGLEYTPPSYSLPRGQKSPTLQDILSANGFMPSKTNLVVTGVLTNRCVLKGAVHAALQGYRVTVVKDATGGDAQEDRWTDFGAPDVGGALPLVLHMKEGTTKVHEHASDVFPLYAVAKEVREARNSKWDLLRLHSNDLKHGQTWWQKSIFLGYKGGPSLADAWKYMHLSGVDVVETAGDL